MKKKVFGLVLILCMFATVAPWVHAAGVIDSGTCGDNSTWTLDDNGTLTISGTGEIKGYAFSRNNRIKNVIIESGVTNTGYNAFTGCTSLETISISDTVAQIDSLSEHGYHFNDFSAIYVNENNPVYSSEDGVLFNKDGTSLLLYPEGKKDETYNVSGHVNGIVNFSNNPYIKKITMPSDSVFKIGEQAFENCTSLTEIEFPTQVEIFRGAVFRGCSSLKNISLPNGVTCLDRTFDGCTSLESIYIPDTVTQIDGTAFRDCTSLTELNIPSTVKDFSIDGLHSCTSLEAVNIDAENESYSLENGVLFSKDNTELLLFPPAKQAEKYIIPDYVKRIADYAFCNCMLLSDIEIPNSVTEIGTYAFFGCTSLVNIKMPDMIDIIDYSTFENCTALQDISIPVTVTKIKSRSFRNCSSIRDIYIPEHVIDIDYYCFTGCTSLEKIGVSPENKNYTSLNDVLFTKDYSRLVQYPLGNEEASYKIPDCVTDCSDAFEGCQNLTNLILSKNIEYIGEGTFAECPLLTAVTIPKDIKRIDFGSFFNCVSLTDVYYEGSESEWGNISIWYKYDTEHRDEYFVNATKHFDTKFPSPEKNFFINQAVSSVNVTNASSEPQSAFVIIANYEDSLLKDVFAEKHIFAPGVTEKFETDGNGSKVFIWNSLNDMYPLCEAKTFTFTTN